MKLSPDILYTLGRTLQVIVLTFFHIYHGSCNERAMQSLSPISIYVYSHAPFALWSQFYFHNPKIYVILGLILAIDDQP